jgi:acyl carrier protein
MGLSKGNILQTIFGAVDEINKMLAEEERLEKLPNTLLTGDGGSLTSLGLINFIVEVEGRIQKDFGLELNLVEALEAPEEPLKSIGRLAEFVVAQANGGGT